MTGAGELSDRVKFQQKITVPDGGGGHAVTWEDRFRVWGRVMIGSVAERLEAGRLEASGQAVLRVRYSTQALEIQPDWRAVIRGVAYQIRQHPEDPYRDRAFLDMQVERGVAI